MTSLSYRTIYIDRLDWTGIRSTRRQTLQLVAAAYFASCTPILAQTSVASILNLAKLLGDAADGLAKLGDGVAHLIKLGSSGLDAVNARKARAKLVGISADLTTMYVSQTATIASLENYGANWPPRPDKSHNPIPQQQQAQWQAVLQRVVAQLAGVESALALVAADRSDFVLQDSYRRLKAALSTREGLLSELSRDPPPTSRADFQSLEKAIEQYHRLHHELDRSIDLFNQYVARLPR